MKYLVLGEKKYTLTQVYLLKFKHIVLHKAGDIATTAPRERLVYLHLMFQIQENANDLQYPKASQAQESRLRSDALHIKAAARLFHTSAIHNSRRREKANLLSRCSRFWGFIWVFKVQCNS